MTINPETLRSLAWIYEDRANASETDAECEAWSKAMTELRRLASGADVVAEAHLANGYCPSCGNELNANDSDCMDPRHDTDTMRAPEAAPETAPWGYVETAAGGRTFWMLTYRGTETALDYDSKQAVVAAAAERNDRDRASA